MGVAGWGVHCGVLAGGHSGNSHWYLTGPGAGARKQLRFIPGATKQSVAGGTSQGEDSRGGGSSQIQGRRPTQEQHASHFQPQAGVQV